MRTVDWLRLVGECLPDKYGQTSAPVATAIHFDHECLREKDSFIAVS